MMDAGFKSCNALQLLKTSAVLHAEGSRIRFFWKELDDDWPPSKCYDVKCCPKLQCAQILLLEYAEQGAAFADASLYNQS